MSGTLTMAMPGMPAPKVASAACPLHRAPLGTCFLCRTADDITTRIEHEICHCRPWSCEWEHSDEGFIAGCMRHGLSEEQAAKVLAAYKERRAGRA